MYSPKIKEELVRQLYQLKLIEKRPITHLANEAIIIYLSQKHTNEVNHDNQTEIRNSN